MSYIVKFTCNITVKICLMPTFLKIIRESVNSDKAPKVYL